MEGIGDGVSRCVVHVDVHGECAMLHVSGCNVVDTEHGRYTLSCMQKLLHGVVK